MTAPDWAKFSRSIETRQDFLTPREKYYKIRETEAIRQAQEHGYFMSANKAYLLEKYGTDQNKRKLSRIKMVSFGHCHLKSVGDIPMCNRLRICILHNNYIVKLDALKACRELVKLDLHSNLISSLPGADFWANLPNLMILNLHDNPIGHIANLHDLAVCRSLTMMTLYDTPVSLKKNYRHHVVNTIWSLRAFDHHVVSDEEIIEDAHFDRRFSTKDPDLKVNICPPMPEDATYMDHIESIRQLLAKISTVMSHNSPVLIVQRYLRGWITRRRYKLIHETRIWAAVTIQRWMRHKKKWMFVPAKSPEKLSPAVFSRVQTPSGPGRQTPVNQRPNLEAYKMDYDIYMQNMRPGSTSTIVQDHISKPRSGSTHKKRRNITINLHKLQQGTLAGLQEDAIAVETELTMDAKHQSQNSARKEAMTDKKSESRKHKKTQSEEKSQRIKIKDIRQFFGPVVENIPTPENYNEEQDEDTPFRLKGLKAKIISDHDAMTDVLRGNIDSGKDVREFESHAHAQKLLEPKPKVTPYNFRSTDKRIFNRVQGTMGLSCLTAVQQAYKDRNQAEKMAAKMEHILNLRESREDAKERVKLFYEEKRQLTLKQRERDKKKAVEALERRELYHLNYIEKNQEKRIKTTDFNQSFVADKTFATDFNAQQNSVSLALQRHDRLSIREDTIVTKTEKVDGTRDEEKMQKDLVRTYLDHRQLMKQSENVMARAALDTKLLQEANERIMNARRRVAKLKAKQKQVQAFYPLPEKTGTTNSKPESQMDRFEALAKMYEGHIGRHPTILSESSVK